MSMPSLDPRQLFDLGRRLAPLRDQEVLVVGSGFTTHNLRLMDFGAGADQAPAAWAAEFDDWVRRALAEGDIDSVLDFQHKAPAARIAHPRIEHFAPLFVSLGASLDQSAPETTVDGFWYGMAKRSVQFG
jgi:4,5-DOPA dioxygenase extradiol